LAAFVLVATKPTNGERPYDNGVTLQVAQKKGRFTYLVLF